MKVLVVNAGSSSLKYQCIEMNNESVICSGGIERIGMGNSKITHKVNGETYEEVKFIANHTEALKSVMDLLLSDIWGVIRSMDEIEAVGHRVLHTGEDFDRSVKIDENVLKLLVKNIPLGPLHMPANIACINSCRDLMPNTPMVAVFDTAFHMTMPKKAYMYAVPYEDYEKYKVRRYGFHGTSHKYVAQKAQRMMIDNPDSRMITCHLGNGSSISAVRGGKCIDTSMGLTPLEGLVMGTRSGDIDPAVLEYLMDKKNINIHEMLEYLNKKSGLLGVSGISSDCREIITAMTEGNERARLAFEMSAYRVKKYIGSYAAALGGLDCIVFTGGIGENSDLTRAEIMKDMEFLGIDFDFELNKRVPKGKDIDLAKPTSKVRVFVIPTNEELVIARETIELIK